MTRFPDPFNPAAHLTLEQVIRAASQPKALLPMGEFRRLRAMAYAMTRRAVREFERDVKAATWREDLQRLATRPAVRQVVKIGDCFYDLGQRSNFTGD